MFRCGYFFFLGTALYVAYAAFRQTPVLLASTAVALVLFGLTMFNSADGTIGDVLGLPALIGGLVLAILQLEPEVPIRAKPTLAAIGDTTYGMYLWHIPVQLLLFILIGETIGEVAEAPWFLLLFLTLVIVLARLGYAWFERPAREAIRRRASVPRRIEEARITAP